MNFSDPNEIESESGVKQLNLDYTKTKPETFWDELDLLMLVRPRIKSTQVRTLIGC